jgi:hypothetical protein
MNPFREMVLLSAHDYKRLSNLILQKKQLDKPPTLMSELNELKDRYGETLPADQRLKLEGDLIAKHTSVLPNETEVDIKPKSDQPDLLLRHVNALPKTHQRRATQIYNHLKDFYDKDPAWNAIGQIKDVNALNMNGSNIIDLIDSVSSARKSNITPKGFGEFLQLLNESNTPTHLLSKAGVDLIGQYKQAMPTQSSNSMSHDDLASLSKWFKI